ncbi:uncharacterized protein LOC117420391 [Acipenser ruthenus]|uniref:uncharacterized protein LOC117420391 n=1 Tax=Acipenser ruthenus TaxID=7906 RepID=UPI00145A0CCE|nr:uncharacterized protein LOC117420391 [Acipenser ruthenus]
MFMTFKLRCFLLTPILLFGIPVHCKEEESTKIILHGERGANILIPGLESSGRVTEWQVQKDPAKSFEPILIYFAQTSEPSIYAEYDKGRIDFFPENASFLLRNLQKSDEGMYRITQDQKIKDSRLYKLCVMEKLVISRKDAVENCSITLSCNITVEGPCRWLKDGGNISHGIFHLSNNQEITLDGTRTDVWGTYTCISGYQTVDYILQSVPGEKCNVRESLTTTILSVIFTVTIVAVFMLFLWKGRRSQRALINDAGGPTVMYNEATSQEDTHHF